MRAGVTEPITPPPPSDAEVVQARPIAALPYALPPPLPPPTPSPLELADLPRRTAVLDLALVLLVTLIVPFGIQLVALVELGQSDLGAPPVWLLTVQKWFDALLACGLVAYLTLRGRQSPACFGLRIERPDLQALWSLGGLAATYAWMIVTVGLAMFLMTAFPALEEDLEHRKQIIHLMPVHSYGWTCLLLAPVAIHEEVVFRALLLPYLRRVTGSWLVAIPISTFIFAGLHFDQGAIGVLQILGVGSVLAVIFVLSRSVITVVAAHFIFDFLQFQFIRLLY
jgi:membrane protease YdiL (CAAX protease family)